MPPLSMLLDVFAFAVAPAALTAAAVLALIQWLGGSKWAPAGSALGLAAGALLGLWLRGALTLTSGLSPWNRLPYAAAGALLVGLAARWTGMPRVAAWLLRAACALTIAWWVLPKYDQPQEWWWLAPAFAALVLAEWALLEHLAAQPPTAEVLLALVLASFTASVIFLYAATARLSEAAIVLGSALAGITLIGWWRRLDIGGAVPGGVVMLLGLLLMGQKETSVENLSWPAFLLPAAAPCLLAVTLPLRHWQGIRLNLLRLALVAAPLVVALYLASLTGPLFEGLETEW